MKGENDETLKTDDEKIEQICKIMEFELNNEVSQSMRVDRIGREQEGVPQMIEVQFNNMAVRDSFVKNSNKLKEAPEAWRCVYVKKDQHPVYISENNKLRTEMKKLKALPENKDKTVVIKDGKLTINGTKVDENLFFR